VPVLEKHWISWEEERRINQLLIMSFKASNIHALSARRDCVQGGTYNALKLRLVQPPPTTFHFLRSVDKIPVADRQLFLHLRTCFVCLFKYYGLRSKDIRRDLCTRMYSLCKCGCYNLYLQWILFIFEGLTVASLSLPCSWKDSRTDLCSVCW
jgi:hypothetical protein